MHVLAHASGHVSSTHDRGASSRFSSRGNDNHLVAIDVVSKSRKPLLGFSDARRRCIAMGTPAKVALNKIWSEGKFTVDTADAKQYHLHDYFANCCISRWLRSRHRFSRVTPCELVIVYYLLASWTYDVHFATAGQWSVNITLQDLALQRDYLVPCRTMTRMQMRHKRHLLQHPNEVRMSLVASCMHSCALPRACWAAWRWRSTWYRSLCAHRAQWHCWQRSQAIDSQLL